MKFAREEVIVLGRVSERRESHALVIEVIDAALAAR
jgi:hypothetical protein